MIYPISYHIQTASGFNHKCGGFLNALAIQRRLYGIFGVRRPILGYCYMPGWQCGRMLMVNSEGKCDEQVR